MTSSLPAADFVLIMLPFKMYSHHCSLPLHYKVLLSDKGTTVDSIYGASSHITSSKRNWNGREWTIAFFTISAKTVVLDLRS